MITSNSNSRIKNVSALIANKKDRTKQGLFVVEGVKLFLEAEPSLIKEVYVSESFSEKLASSVEASSDSNVNKASEKLELLISQGKIAEGNSYDIVADSVFKKMSDTVTPQGIITVLEDKKLSVADFSDTNGKSTVLVLEGLQDPGNIGTIIRTAEAAGVSFILADKNTVDNHSSKVIRSTMGSIFRVPVIYTDNLNGEINKLKEKGFSVYAAHLKGDKTYREIEYSGKSIILIGNEGNGLSDEISELADVLVKIPMKGRVESLNAAVAAALMMFECQ